MNNVSRKQAIKDFFKENIYFFILGSVVLLFSIIVIVATATSTKNNIVSTPIDKEPVSNITTYYLPVVDATIMKDYSDSELQYNSTLNQWEAHKSIDFVASSGSEVRSITSGKVIDVYSNYLEGNVIKIQHDNGLISEYGSLGEELKVNKGDTVSANAVIGYVSATANAEVKDGAHLHFTMYDESGNKIDPAGYLNISAK